MNTIIYVYHSREITQFITEKWQEEDYCLIRLGIPCLLWKNLKDADEWQNPSLQAQDETGTELAVKADGEGLQDAAADRNLQGRWRRIKGFLGTWGLRRKAGKTNDLVQAAPIPDEETLERERMHSRILESMEELKELQIALCLLGNNPHWTYCVYEDYLRDKIDTKCWREYWRIPEFRDYHEYIWVEKLMVHAIPGHYMILGYADCVPRIICGQAAQMRSVKWFLQERQLPQELQDFLEDFYAEYGLAVEVRTVEEEWVRFRPASAMPVTVLDFTGEEKLSPCDVADGSIWLDMDAMDGKNRRMEARKSQIFYFSLKKHWKQRQKEGFHLDTLTKNGYNNQVK